jgi:copper chaperone
MSRFDTLIGYIDVRERTAMETAVYTVPGMSCSHCEAAVREEVSAVSGVESVSVDVRGSALDDVALRAAIEEAGYEAE